MQFIEKFRVPSRAATLAGTYGFWRSLILAVILALSAAWGVFASIDTRLYDFFVRSAVELGPVKRQVALVESPVSAFANATVHWGTLVNELISLGAAQVVFTVIPEGDNDAIASLLNNPKVVLGADLMRHPDRSDGLLFGQPAGQPANAAKLSTHAVSGIPASLHGIHRSQQYAYRVGEEEVPGLEAMTARRLGIDVPDAGQYLVDFGNSASGFPRMTLRDVLDDGLIKDVVQGRVILIGPASERFHRTVATPITEGDGEISELEYHAYALDSLLRGAAIASLHPIANGIFLIVIWIACFFAFQPMPFRKAVATASLLALGLSLLAYLLVMQHFHFPVFGAILVIGSSLVGVFHSKTEHQNQALARLVMETNLAAAGHLTGQSVPTGAAFWSHVLAMVDQILPLTRVVLLERVDGTRHLRDVCSLRCTTDTIGERRRDFGRAPYLKAVEKSETVEVANYLKDAKPGEHQFLSPLVWNGQVLGFWAFGVDQSQLLNRPMLMRAVDVLSKRLSELLFERRQGMLQTATAPEWRDYLIDRRDLSINRLTEHLQVIDRHINVLEDMFNGLEAPTMVYDLFGRPLVSNARMKALLKTADVNAEGQSAADMLESVCMLSAEEARAALVSVIFEGYSFERAARVANTKYLVHVSRLRNSATPVATGQDVLQHIHGLMIQLFPVSSLEVRERQRATQSLQRETSDLDDLSDIEAQQGEEEVDVLHEIEAAIASTVSIPEHEALSFSVQGLQEQTKVLANPRKLRDTLSTLIRFLAEDSKQAGKVTVTLDTDGDHLVVDLQNDGFGMPDEKLQAMLEGSSLPKSDLLRRIRELRGSAFGDKSRVAISSTVGIGYVAKAIMPLAN